MILTRQNPWGGKPLSKNAFPLHFDENGQMGFLVGYVDRNTKTGEKILLPVNLAGEIGEHFIGRVTDFHRRFNEFKPKKSLRQRVIEWLGGLQPVDNQ